MHLIIATKHFNKPAQERVGNQICGKHLAIKTHAVEKSRESEIESQVQERFVNLRGMHRSAVGPMILWKSNRPGQIGRATVTAASHQTANPSKNMAQCDAWRNHVRHPPKG